MFGRGAGFDSGEDPFERMMQQHNSLLSELLGGRNNPFGRPLFHDPMFGSMMDFHRSSSFPAMSSIEHHQQQRQTRHRRPQHSLSVTELSENGEEMTEEERKQLELAIAQSLSDVRPTVPHVVDLDSHNDRSRPSRFSQSSPINLEEDEMMDAISPEVMNIEDDDEELRQALELSRREEERRQRLQNMSKEEIERTNLMNEQRMAYEESIKQDLEKRTKLEFKDNWPKMNRNITAEPLESDPNATRLVIKLPTGERLNRRFPKTLPLSAVKLFVDDEIAKRVLSSSEHPLVDFIPSSPLSNDQTYDLATDFPNVVFEDDGKTLEALGLHPRALISVRSRK